MPDVKNENTDTSIPSKKDSLLLFLYNPQKYYKYNYEMISRQLVLEADILKKLNHPGLPKIIDIIEKKDVYSPSHAFASCSFM